MKEKVRLYEAMQKKFETASLSEKIQILPLVPDKWSRSTAQNILNTFKKIKKVGGILAKSASKKRKNYHD